MSVRNVARRRSSVSIGPEVYNARRFPMPLPKSVICSACKKSYPEGWKRCPYCGHDELRAKQESQSRKFMQRKMQEFEQRTGKKRREDEKSRPPRERDQRERPARGERPQRSQQQRPQRAQQQQPQQAQAPQGEQRAPGRR